MSPATATARATAALPTSSRQRVSNYLTQINQRRQLRQPRIDISNSSIYSPLYIVYSTACQFLISCQTMRDFPNLLPRLPPSSASLSLCLPASLTSWLARWRLNQLPQFDNISAGNDYERASQVAKLVAHSFHTPPLSPPFLACSCWPAQSAWRFVDISVAASVEKVCFS